MLIISWNRNVTQQHLLGYIAILEKKEKKRNHCHQNEQFIIKAFPGETKNKNNIERKECIIAKAIHFALETY